MYNFYQSNNINTRWFILFGLALHLIASYFSIGYYSEDEHYQILGPVEKLLGIENTLTWEFEYKIRPWIQPYFYYFIIKIFEIFNIKDPFILIFILRTISSIIGFMSIYYLYNHLKFRFNLDNNFSKFIIFGFWFYAFLHARTSAENLSIAVLIFGVILFDKLVHSKNIDKYKYSILSGIFLGLSIVLKLQNIISVFFVYIWFLINKLNPLSFFYSFVSGLVIILILLLGLVFDYFGYGSFNLTYYQYYHANFVSKWFEHFGDDPWWYYFKLVIEGYFPPVSIIIIFSILFFSLKEFKSLLNYITIPVIIILSLLSNKELRFLFPVLIFSPFYISYVFSNTNYFFAKTFLINLIIFFNIFFMIILFIPATEEVKIYEYLYYNKNNESKILYLDENPYIMDGLEPKFYTYLLPKISKFENDNDISNSLIIVRNYNDYKKIINNQNCKLAYSVYPEIVNLNKNWRERKFNWYIISCD